MMAINILTFKHITEYCLEVVGLDCEANGRCSVGSTGFGLKKLLLFC